MDYFSENMIKFVNYIPIDNGQYTCFCDINIVNKMSNNFFLVSGRI